MFKKIPLPILILTALTACTAVKPTQPTPQVATPMQVAPSQKSLASPTNERLTVHTPSGIFEGWQDDNVVRFQGIRYATSERYGTPSPFIYPKGEIVKAQSPAPVASQNHSPIESALMGMDYLAVKQDEFAQYLSITLPKGVAKNTNLPVMVWLHGGSYRNGGLDNVVYNPELIASQHNVIVVGIGYRLGVLGYLRDKDGNLANLGLLDQIAGLKWVKQNIAEFGGNADNITLFGESAGGNSVQHLLIADGTKGLFKRAIIQSNPFGTMANRTNISQSMLNEFNKLPINASLDTILAKQSDIEQTMSKSEKSNAKYMIFAPHYGVYPLPKEQDLDKAWADALNSVDILVGANSKEANAYLIATPTLAKINQMPVLGYFTQQKLDKLSQEVFIEPALQFAQKFAPAKGKMYHYHITWGENDSAIGAGHTMELPLLFGAKFLPSNSPMLMNKSADEVEKYGYQLRKIWVNFAKTGQIDTLKIDKVIEIKAMD